MTRFHVIAITAAVLGTLALVFGNLAWFIIVLLAFGLVIGLGVTFPQLSLFGVFVCHGDPARRCVASR